jgi:ATP-binding cassette, subfamily F, member 3
MEISVKEISKCYKETEVLNKISFSLGRRQKIGLAGDNGVGKSTLLKILAGIVKPDSGLILKRKGLTISYVPQDPSFNQESAISVYDYLFQEVFGERKNDLLQSEQGKQGNDKNFQHRMELFLSGFGLGEIKKERLINTLSSGQKSKLFLTGVLLSNPDLLLLDEPTNSLDLPALIWLEDFLHRSKTALIVVSHDRLFLDRIVSKVFEIDKETHSLKIIRGRYFDYLTQLEKEWDRQRREYEEQRKTIKRLKKTIKIKKNRAVQGARFQGKDNDKFQRGFKRDRAAKSGKTAKAIEKRLEQIELIKKPVEKDIFRIFIQPLKTEGSKSIILDQVVAGYSDNGFSLDKINMVIPYGARVIILGLNGVGKSTLLRTISGELPALSGRVEIGKGLVMGNLMQEHDNLPRRKSLKEFLVQRTDLETQEIYNLISKFGFRAEEIDKKIDSFSPGARSRLLLALFSSLSVNVLLLDEPTNHLDLEALNALEEAIDHYQGTIILISHDRYFLKRFRSTATYLLSEKKLIRQTSFQNYLKKAEKKSQRLIKILHQ